MRHIGLIGEIANPPKVGDVTGICRITGKESVGMLFNKWVKKTFTDLAYLHEGDIISNEAAFCFCEVNSFFAEIVKRDKPQNFRTYSHIVTKNKEWLCLTKSDKQEIVRILQGEPVVVSITDTGKKHIFFKHRYGFWQLDELHVLPNLDLFNRIHGFMMDCLKEGYNQTEIKTGIYKQTTLKKVGLERYLEVRRQLDEWRGMPMFDFAAWLMYSL